MTVSRTNYGHTTYSISLKVNPSQIPLSDSHRVLLFERLIWRIVKVTNNFINTYITE